MAATAAAAPVLAHKMNNVKTRIFYRFLRERRGEAQFVILEWE